MTRHTQCRTVSAICPHPHGPCWPLQAAPAPLYASTTRVVSLQQRRWTRANWSECLVWCTVGNWADCVDGGSLAASFTAHWLRQRASRLLTLHVRTNPGILHWDNNLTTANKNKKQYYLSVSPVRINVQQYVAAIYIEQRGLGYGNSSDHTNIC